MQQNSTSIVLICSIGTLKQKTYIFSSCGCSWWGTSHHLFDRPVPCQLMCVIAVRVARLRPLVLRSSCVRHLSWSSVRMCYQDRSRHGFLVKAHISINQGIGPFILLQFISLQSISLQLLFAIPSAYGEFLAKNFIHQL